MTYSADGCGPVIHQLQMSPKYYKYQMILLSIYFLQLTKINCMNRHAVDIILLHPRTYAAKTHDKTASAAKPQMRS